MEIPFFFLGTPSGHDVEFHLYSWLEVLAQWKHGIVYPRWAALAHFGYGEPRFLFYPPASWTLGAALSAIFPWSVASCIYIWIVLVAAGVAMFVVARRWLDPQKFDRSDAIFVAVLYAVNPYHLVIIYWRSAFAELLASCLVPLLLLFVLKLWMSIGITWRKAIVPPGAGAGGGLADECSGGGDDPLFAGAAGGVLRVAAALGADPIGRGGRGGAGSGPGGVLSASGDLRTEMGRYCAGGVAGIASGG